MSAIREIIAYFGMEVDSSELDKGKEKLESFVDTLKSVGEKFAAAFAVEKVKEFVMGMAEAAEKLEIQAQTIGMSTDALQQWHLAADLSGVSAGQLDAAMMRLQRTAGGKGGQALAAMGIQAKDAHGNVKPMNDLMEDVADKIHKIEDPAKRAEAATKLFGKTGAKMIPFLKEGREGIHKMREEMRELGGGMSEDFIKKSKELVENSKRLSFAWESLKVRIVGLLIPAFEQIVVWLTKGVVFLIKLSESSSLLETTLTALGIAAVIAFSSMLGPIGALLLELLPIIAVFLLFEDFITFLRGGDSEFGRALDALFGDGAAEKVRTWIMSAIQDFTDFVGAITGGSSEGSKRWREDWNVFSEALQQDLGVLGSVIIWFLDLFKGGWKNALDQIGAVFDYTVGALKIAWASFVRGSMSGVWLLQDTFADFVNGLLEGVKLILLGMKAVAEAAHQTGIVSRLDDALGFVQKSSLMDRHGREGNAEADTATEDARNQMQRAQDVLSGRADGPRVTAAKAQEIYDRENGTGTRVNEQTNHININVPHGTPHGVAHAAGEAAQEGVNRANAAALIPGDG